MPISEFKTNCVEIGQSNDTIVYGYHSYFNNNIGVEKFLTQPVESDDSLFYFMTNSSLYINSPLEIVQDTIVDPYKTLCGDDSEVFAYLSPKEKVEKKDYFFIQPTVDLSQNSNTISPL